MQKYRVILTGAFNVPNYNWFNDTPLPDTLYYSKIKGNLFHATTCFLCLNQHNDTVPNGSLLDPVFTNISDLVYLWLFYGQPG
jgi:hypothetical protein